MEQDCCCTCAIVADDVANFNVHVSLFVPCNERLLNVAMPVLGSTCWVKLELANVQFSADTKTYNGFATNKSPETTVSN